MKKALELVVDLACLFTTRGEVVLVISWFHLYDFACVMIRFFDLGMDTCLALIRFVCRRG